MQSFASPLRFALTILCTYVIESPKETQSAMKDAMNGPGHTVLSWDRILVASIYMSAQPNTLAATSTVILATPSH